MTATTPAIANEIDVYFITGQSNGNNFAKQASVGTTDVGFTLHAARSGDSFIGYYPDNVVASSLESSLLNTSLATPILATQLQQGGRDVAIFTFARNGAGLSLGPDSWVWYPGDDPVNGQVYNDSMYYNFVNWTQARLDELTSDGHIPTVKGLFWFQGEKDGRLGDHEAYEDNFNNLLYRLHENYGQNLPVVTTEIREVTDTAANRAVINDTLEAISNADPLIGFVQTSDLEFRSATDVHLSNAGYAALAPRWATEMLAIQANVPGPTSPADLDGDGDIDEDDLTIVLNNFGSTGSPINGDATGDGSIGIDDLNLVLANWTANQPPSVLTPEPSTLALLGLAGLLATRRRRG